MLRNTSIIIGSAGGLAVSGCSELSPIFVPGLWERHFLRSIGLANLSFAVLVDLYSLSFLIMKSFRFVDRMASGSRPPKKIYSKPGAGALKFD